MKQAGLAVSILLLALLLSPAGDLLARAPDDGRAAIVTDRQGVALVRPLGRDRWTPLSPRSLLMPGDLVRTPVRGANALEFRLAAGGGVVLGPNSLLDVKGASEVKLVRGEAEVEGRGVLRAKGGEITVLPEAPRWLVGYRASTTDEWMGSLVAEVDGRNTPLAIGYHKVDVVIRDQIAVTTIEESFRNATDARLEGVFTFPLPADASISGFGMWIGDELVEADIVEKQRARQIYEDILRRRKDPGLLEWSGGNLFKARVFPIFGHSEKRIRIRYTQVLPLQGSALAYRYALRSELLRHTPLRELQIRVTVHSETPIREAGCVSHEARVRKTEHSAVIEYQAEEVTPDRDFEVRVDLAGRPALAAIPHRRGEDGYFMLLLSPPDPTSDGWRRELTPEGAPLDVVLLADTSGSMDPAQRGAQADFVESLLSLLGEKDRFRLAVTDAETKWWRPEPVPATAGNVASALAFLAARDSLGWSDLLRGLADAAGVAGEGAHVIYVGDGIGTTGNADPNALAKAIDRLGERAKATFHSAFTGSAYEKAVLDAIARIGGGSVRDAAADPARAAYRLLAEVAQPVVKDLRVEFSGIRTARVYPRRPPNLPAGAQQAIIGRFLPTGRDQRGTVTVSGTLEGKPVRYSAELVVKDDEAGNSFLPRLWARRHLDALLEEAPTPALKAEIVAFSEEFGIMTPYTSFLVLENDEMREQYGVTRRVKMRDAERFFAEGKEKADTEILAEQMREARTWRQGLQRRMLAEIRRLGRNLLSPQVAWGRRGGYRGPMGEVSPRDAYNYRTETGAKSMVSGAPAGSELADRSELLFKDGEGDGADLPPDSREPVDGQPAPDLAGAPMEEGEPMAADELAAARPASSPAPPAGPVGGLRQDFRRMSAEYSLGAGGGAGGRFRSINGVGSDGPWGGPAYGQSWIAVNALGYFPALPPGPPPEPAKVEPPEWKPEILALIERLDGGDVLTGYDGGLDTRFTTTGFHPIRGEITSLSESRGILSPKSWLLESASPGQPPLVNWTADGVRAVLDRSLRLGRRRPAAAEDRSRLTGFPGLPSWKHFLNYREWTAGLTDLPDGRVQLSVTSSRKDPSAAWTEYRLVIDPERAVVLEQQTWQSGKLGWTTTWSDFVKAAGRWWPTRMEGRDPKGHRGWLQELTIEEIPAADAEKRIGETIGDLGDVVFLPPVLPDYPTAKQAVKDGEAGFAERLVVALEPSARGEWDELWRAFADVEKAADGKPGLAWVRAYLLSQSRRGEEAKRLLSTLADAAAKAKDDGIALALAVRIQGLAQSAIAPNEILEILDRLAPVWERPTAPDYLKLNAVRLRAQVLANAGRHTDAVRLWEQVLAARPGDLPALLGLLNPENPAGIDAVLERGLRELDKEDLWQAQEIDQIYRHLTGLLWNAHRYDDFVRVLERWTARETAPQDAWTMRLTGLLFVERSDEVTEWIGKRLAEGLGENPTAGDRARLGAAVRFALGQGWNLYTNRLSARWEEPLASLAHRLLRSEVQDGWIAHQILSHWRFQQTDAWAELRPELYAELAGEVAEMSLARLGRYLGVLSFARNQADEATWRTVVDALRARWETAGDPNDRASCAGWVVNLLDARGAKAEAIAFLRMRLATATDDERPGVAGQLAGRLAQEPCTAEIEAELFGLVPMQIHAKWERPQRRAQFATSARWLADVLYRGRVVAALPPAEEREKLPRAELREKAFAARQTVRAALAERFLAEAAKADEDLRPFYGIESLCFAAEAGDDAKAVEGRAREILLGAASEAPDYYEWVDRERSSLVLSYLAVRRDATPELAERVLALYRERLGAESEILDWRYQILRLLTALDRRDDLITALRSWIDPGKVGSRWRIALAYLLAESGDLKGAAAELTAVAALGELDEAGYLRLADYHLALGDEAARRRALAERFRVVDEYVLQQRVWQYMNRVSRRGDGVPEDLDPEAFPTLAGLMAKASRPANHLYVVQRLYRETKDFRALECLADAVTGHSAESTYEFLARLWSAISEVHEEATLDTIAAKIAERRGAVQAPTDKRALHLLSALVERRAAMVLNQPGPHAEQAVAALSAGFPDEWRPGEIVHYANFLGSLGRIEVDALAAEQLRQLTAISRLTGPGTAEALAVAHHLARLYWAYGRQEDAVDLITLVLKEHRDASGGALPPAANQAANSLVSWLTSLHRFTQAEAWLVEERGRQPDDGRKAWYTVRLHRLYADCLNQGGSVSLGQGEALYRAVRDLLLEDMLRIRAQDAPGLLSTFVEVHRTAHRRVHVKSAGPDLVAFSKSAFYEVVSRMPDQERNKTQEVAQAIHDLVGPLAGIEFYVEVLEREGDWRRDYGREGFRHYVHSLAKWRTEAKDLGPLEARLLAVVLRELEWDLTAGESRCSSFAWKNQGWFWTEKESDFAAVARKVIEIHAGSAAIVLHTASYLWGGLKYREEAVRVLEAADARGKLREQGRHQLVSWLHELKRWEDALPHAARLVREKPDEIEYRVLMIRTLHHISGRDEDGLGALDEAVARWKKQDRWQEQAIDKFGAIALECAYYARSMEFYEEAIGIHERNPRRLRPGQDGVLPVYYASLARAYSGLGRTDDAVRAATSAVVAWGPNDHSRGSALSGLRAVIAGIPDLDAWAANYEAEVAKTGLDAPVIRKSLGQVYLTRKDPERAIHHLLVARELMPADADVHRMLVQAYDTAKDAAGAIAAVRAWIAEFPRELKLYEDLARRLAKDGDEAGADRALTSLVESEPHEANGHRELAKARERQKRFADAAEQWRQVVRIRTFEPDGWFGLAAALARAGEKEAAVRTLDEIIDRHWNPRFGKVRDRAAKEKARLQ